MTTPVSFEIAKTLKEKGFDNIKSSSLFYSINSKSTYAYPYNITKDEYLSDREQYKSYYVAPTIAEVVMWLYEKHGIWIAVDLDDDNTFVCVVRSKAAIAVFDNAVEPTEAYEAAIEYSLKNLIP